MMPVNNASRRMTRLLVLTALLSAMPLSSQSVADNEHKQLRSARDRQDLAALHSAATQAEAASRSDGRPAALYSAALARSFEAEVALELGKKAEAAAAAEAGIETGQRLVELQPKVAEYHRILGTLCGQVIPANLWSAFKYGRCAREEIETALTLDPNSAWARIGRGVGNYYLPESFGGGVDKAIDDFRRASSLQPKLADAWLWLGIALRKKGDLSAAKTALETGRKLAPERIWIERQLEKVR
ncbi:MAG: hypothetical protein LC114_27140 [Bryobacterales bacterium]|nr:hypothetical protein [Bryobacterales bacterium]